MRFMPACYAGFVPSFGELRWHVRMALFYGSLRRKIILGRFCDVCHVFTKNDTCVAYRIHFLILKLCSNDKRLKNYFSSRSFEIVFFFPHTHSRIRAHVSEHSLSKPLIFGGSTIGMNFAYEFTHETHHRKWRYRQMCTQRTT